MQANCGVATRPRMPDRARLNTATLDLSEACARCGVSARRRRRASSHGRVAPPRADSSAPRASFAWLHSMFAQMNVACAGAQQHVGENPSGVVAERDACMTTKTER